MMTSDINIYPGLTDLAFNTYPAKCKVKISLNGKFFTEGVSSVSGSFTCSFDNSIRQDDYITVEISKEGWQRKVDNYFTD
ncbi:hypothetical protein [Peptoniphilus duerdenii]|nr:hypothetical protein [Peptoniphilus duerdenii]